MNARPNGYVLQETSEFVVISTGHSRPSANVKTGPMLQIWILPANESPGDAVRNGTDDSVCGDCPLRGIRVRVHVMGDDLSEPRFETKDRACYVDVDKAPGAIWRAWKAGRYPVATVDALPYLFLNERIRFGAYGDPGLMNPNLLARLAQMARKHTGYTHMWRNLGAPYRHYLMASTDTPEDVAEATNRGWRWFGLIADSDRAQELGAVICPAGSNGVTCATCGLCAGSLLQAKNVAITPHGSGARYASTVDVDPLDWAEAMADRMEAQTARYAVQAARGRDFRRACVGSHNMQGATT